MFDVKYSKTPILKREKRLKLCVWSTLLKEIWKTAIKSLRILSNVVLLYRILYLEQKKREIYSISAKSKKNQLKYCGHLIRKKEMKEKIERENASIMWLNNMKV